MSHKKRKSLTKKEKISCEKKKSNETGKSLARNKKISQKKRKSFMAKEKVFQQNKENKLKTIMINKTICTVVLLFE